MSWYGYLALVSLVMCQYLMFQKAEPFYTFFTPIQWWNYIFFIDAILKKREKKSPITSQPVEFLLMMLLSVFCWLIFEFYNFLLHNWYYVNLATERWQRFLGEGLAFATIFPGIFLTADVLQSFGFFSRRKQRTKKLSSTFLLSSFFGGLAAVIFPILLPSPYVFGLVWLGFFFLLEPVNYWLEVPSIYRDIEDGNWQTFWILMVGGAICGFLWEFWNYWAHAKWIYTVPFTRNIKYFEMPVLGLLGFPPFALECFAMYQFTRRLISTRL